MNAEQFAKELMKVPPDEPPPSGTYTCDCPWSGWIISHYCPVHPAAWPIFEIREPRK